MIRTLSNVVRHLPSDIQPVVAVVYVCFYCCCCCACFVDIPVVVGCCCCCCDRVTLTINVVLVALKGDLYQDLKITATSWFLSSSMRACINFWRKRSLKILYFQKFWMKGYWVLNQQPKSRKRQNRTLKYYQQFKISFVKILTSSILFVL